MPKWLNFKNSFSLLSLGACSKQKIYNIDQEPNFEPNKDITIEQNEDMNNHWLFKRRS